jgi:alpha-ketoglutarate-dependent taurine dioxygenase
MPADPLPLNQDRFPDGRRYIPGEGWHTDHSNDARPPKATALHAVTLPDRGGDTQFANMAAAQRRAIARHAGSGSRTSWRSMSTKAVTAREN